MAIADSDTPAPFRALGHGKGVYYYYVRGSEHIVALTTGGHKKLELLGIAPIEWWENTFKSKAKNHGCDWDLAASNLIESCHRNGLFTPELIRGRGAWLDGEESVMHFGDRVSVKGVDYKPYNVVSRYLYETALPLNIKPSSPLSDDESRRLIDVFQPLKFATENQYKWLLGWIIIAMVSGALTWRPHMWLIGAAQNGKSTLITLIKQLLSKNSLHVQSNTSEAGIRQELVADALPILFDEIENEDNSAIARIQNILTLARQSSSNTEGRIIKGSVSGRSMKFLIRSCFFLASINANLVQTADKGRFTVVELMGKITGQKYQDWLKNKVDLLTPEYINGLYGRVFGNILTITKNAQMFANAIEKKCGDRRLGDQYGTLMSGFYLMESTAVITQAEAEKYIADISFAVEIEAATGRKDEYKLLQIIQEKIITIWNEKQPTEYTISECCRIFDGQMEHALKLLGITVKDNMVLISNSNTNFAAMLKGTPYHHDWATALKRIKGATMYDKAVRLAGSLNRCVAIPIDLFTGNETKVNEELDF